ncbi:MAG: exodeoxyribonuclease VII small subunit [Anaerovoracaceae bacterium]|jgi:exodeoxyribonuclease VII small subunit
MAEKQKTFEEELFLLEECAKKLRDKDVPLEEALKSFEEGILHFKRCNEILNAAKEKIETFKEEE